MPAITIIIALYNAEMHLQRFLQSLENQTFKDFEALFIDDASTDNSVDIVTAWGDSRFKVIRNEVNCGAGAVRNTGIRVASGETICFADPDDVLPEKSLESRYYAYKKFNAVVRACYLEIDANGYALHLEKRPQEVPEICVPRQCSTTQGITAFLSAHCAWLFPTKFIQKNCIVNTEGTKTAEDIQFLVNAFFHLARVVWIPDVAYHWIKRDNSLSTKTYSAEHYCDYLDCVGSFYEEAKRHGSVYLADMLCDTYFATYLGHLAMQLSGGKSSDSDASQIIAHAASICEKNTVFQRYLPDSNKRELLRGGILRLWYTLKQDKGSPLNRLTIASEQVKQKQRELFYEQIHQIGWQGEIFFDAFDSAKRLLRARYLFCDTPVTESLTCDTQPLTAAYAKNRLVHQGEGFTIYERLLWLPVPHAMSGKYTFTLADGKVALDMPVAEIPLAFSVKPPPADSTFPPEIKALRKLATSKPIQDRFKEAWMFIDSDVQADDNAEHLYRWVMNHHPEINAFFVLRQDSSDWNRLAKEGFRLIPFDSMEHRLLFILAKNLISSHMDAYIYNAIDKKFIGDIRDCKFTSLGHGVINEDVSRWLNTIPLDCFVTTTPGEYQSIIADGTAYTLTQKEVVLSGFPRYDHLLQAEEPDKTLLVMPSWRANIAEVWDEQQGRYTTEFTESLFAKAWSHFLTSPELATLCQQFGYTVLLRPHNHFAEYLYDLGLPEYIKTPTKEPLQNLFPRCGLLVTDFSSSAFDMAFMHRPVLYYHFESHEQFAKAQNHSPGYFSYERDGFGPVCSSAKELLKQLAVILANQGQSSAVYLERIAKTFDFQEGKCCLRAVEAINNLHRFEE